MQLISIDEVPPAGFDLSGWLQTNQLSSIHQCVSSSINTCHLLPVIKRNLNSSFLIHFHNIVSNKWQNLMTLDTYLPLKEAIACVHHIIHISCCWFVVLHFLIYPPHFSFTYSPPSLQIARAEITLNTITNRKAGMISLSLDWCWLMGKSGRQRWEYLMPRTGESSTPADSCSIAWQPDFCFSCSLASL